MNRPLRRVLFEIGVLLSAIVVFVSVRGRYVEHYRDNILSGGEIRHPWDVFAVHVARPQYVIIGGKTYRWVRGQPPYYVRAPGTNVILFVTAADAGKVTFHLYNLDSHQQIEIKAGSTGFGSNIGSGYNPGEPYTDYIESMTGEILTVVKRSTDWKEVITANLERKAVVHIETMFFDKTGSITNRIVWNSTKNGS